MSTNENEKNWSNLAIDAWLDTLDPKKLTFKKLVYVTKQCLNVMSLNDAGKFMTKHKFTVTDEYFQSKNEMLSDENLGNFLFIVNNDYSVRINKFINDLKMEMKVDKPNLS